MDKARQFVKEEIAKQKSEILTDDEYHTIIEDSKKRNLQYIAIFRASK